MKAEHPGVLLGVLHDLPHQLGVFGERVELRELLDDDAVGLPNSHANADWFLMMSCSGMSQVSPRQP